jgi:molybdopterin synthase sulfur carrier subunit
MSVTVHLSGHLKPYTGGVLEVTLPGDYATVGDALDSLWNQHKGLRDRVLTEQGEIRRHVNVFAGGRDVKRAKGLDTVLNSDELHIFNAVSGG